MKWSRTGSFGSSDWITPQVTSAFPQSQEEADLYFVQANNGNTTAQSALNKYIIEYNHLQKEGLHTPHAIEYVMSMFNHMVSAPQ